MDELKNVSTVSHQSELVHSQHNCKSHMQLHRHQDRSPVRDPYLKGSHSRVLVAEKDKHMVNRNKWENLQRKISSLRNENETLKRSLF